MQVWTAFLRGVNVGGHRKIPMADLRAICPGTQVRSYIASGNLIFAADGDAPGLAATLQARIAAQFGFDVPVLVLSAPALGQLLQACPFAGQAGNQVLGYLCLAPPQCDHAGIDALRAGAEQVAVTDRTVWLHAPGGIGQSKLAAKLEKLIGVPSTARNLNTLTKVAELAKTG